ncbi:hypothetical protein Tco_1450104 [Tanacetum coccineum]
MCRQYGILGQRFSLNKSSDVHEKTNTPRSCLRWKPTGRIFKTVGLRWIPTGKVFIDSTTKVDSEPPNGSKMMVSINTYECNQTLYVCAGRVLTVQIYIFGGLHDLGWEGRFFWSGKSISLTEAEEEVLQEKFMLLMQEFDGEAVAKRSYATHARILSGPDLEHARGPDWIILYKITVITLGINFEDDQEKSKVVDESDSTIPDPSHLIRHVTPPVVDSLHSVSCIFVINWSLLTINTEGLTITTSLSEITSFIALQQEWKDWKQEMSEVKKTRSLC